MGKALCETANGELVGALSLVIVEQFTSIGSNPITTTNFKLTICMKHVMIDLETLGTSADAVWLSIAAIQFDPYTGQMGERFNVNVDLGQAMKDRKISPSTLQWWLEQRPEIMKKMFDSPQDLNEALYTFKEWCETLGIDYPWGNSASFDLGILVNTYTSWGIELPWKFYNERCYRTIATLAGIGVIKDDKKAHDPMYDCEIQIEALTRAYKILNIK